MATRHIACEGSSLRTHSPSLFLCNGARRQVLLAWAAKDLCHTTMFARWLSRHFVSIRNPRVPRVLHPAPADEHTA